MTSTPTTQPCPACGALVYYEGHSELRGTLVPHRFHCHSCGRAYVVRSTSHRQPRFALSARHEVREVIEHPPEAPAPAPTPPVPEVTTEVAREDEAEAAREEEELVQAEAEERPPIRPG